MAVARVGCRLPVVCCLPRHIEQRPGTLSGFEVDLAQALAREQGGRAQVGARTESGGFGADSGLAGKGIETARQSTSSTSTSSRSGCRFWRLRRERATVASLRDRFRIVLSRLGARGDGKAPGISAANGRRTHCNHGGHDDEKSPSCRWCRSGDRCARLFGQAAARRGPGQRRLGGGATPTSAARAPAATAPAATAPAATAVAVRTPVGSAGCSSSARPKCPRRSAPAVRAGPTVRSAGRAVAVTASRSQSCPALLARSPQDPGRPAACSAFGVSTRSALAARRVRGRSVARPARAFRVALRLAKPTESAAFRVARPAAAARPPSPARPPGSPASCRAAATTKAYASPPPSDGPSAREQWLRDSIARRTAAPTDGESDGTSGLVLTTPTRARMPGESAWPLSVWAPVTSRAVRG